MFDPKVVKTLALISQLGISMMVPIFLMAWLGAWVDERFSTRLFPVFLILGIGGGFRSVYTLVRHANEDPHKEKKDEQTDKWGD
ncbi:MAG: AtpZ/AtpI family protein [Lachnospiraceae bacterium]|nr:AtpZ/AtpI family protein [Lachnospiraceae bacterium]